MKRMQERQSPRIGHRHRLRLEPLERRDLLAFNPLVISEINYHPPHAIEGAADNDLFEFVELYNAGDIPIQLSGVNIQGRSGTISTFSVTLPSRVLQPGEYGLVVRHPTSIISRYNEYDSNIQSKIVAAYVGDLPNASTPGSAQATIRIVAPDINETQVLFVNYDDREDYPSRPDGLGPTLVLADSRSDLDAAFYADGDNWRSSPEYGGSPGRAGLETHEPRVVINEILANSNNAIRELDRIELANISTDSIDLGGWIISDPDDNGDGGENDVGANALLKAYTIPNGVVLRPGQYFVVDESQFNSVTDNNRFGISSSGDSLALVSRESDGTRLLEDYVEFDATRTSQSIGRAPNLTGSFIPLTTTTFGSANSAHVESPIVISEIMYKLNPTLTTADENLHYIELYNPSAASVTMTGWEVNGVGYTFPPPVAGQPAINIPAGQTAVIVRFDPVASPTLAAQFKTFYGNQNAVLYGPFVDANLSNNGERLALLQPYVDGLTTTKVLVDSVDFAGESPWPEAPAGGIPFGSETSTPYSLHRVTPGSIGDQPHSWRGALPTPGTFAPLPTSSPLEGVVISEIMFDPVAWEFDENGDPLPEFHLEFVEILNTTATPKDLSQAGIGQGVTYRFPIGTSIASNERIVVAPFDPAINSPQRDQFIFRYDMFDSQIRLFGPWGSGNIFDDDDDGAAHLNNGGESLGLFDNIGNTFFEFTYNDRGDWPNRAAGNGSSLEVIDPYAIPSGVHSTSAYLNDPTVWRASTEVFGSPGRAGVGPIAPSIVINEVTSHTDPRYSDAVELFNVSSSPVNLAEWLLTDRMEDPSHFSLLPPMTLQPGEYVTFDVCEAGNTCEGGVINFGISGANGDELYLMSADELSGRIVNFVDYVEVPATFGDDVEVGGVSLGRWPNGTGELFPMKSRTISQFNTTPSPGFTYTNGANSGPLVSDVVISEFMYAPSGANAYDFEYVELFNRSMFPLNLGPLEVGDDWTDNTPQGWRIKGSVDFEFEAAHLIAARGALVVVGFDPANTLKLDDFRARYGIDASVQIVGPFERLRALPDGGGEIRLDRPDFAPLDLPPEERFTPNVLVDRVTYDDAYPWPILAAGNGRSLSRAGEFQFGDSAESWFAATPSPGSFAPTGPRVTSVAASGNAWSQEFRRSFGTPVAPSIGYAVPSGAAQFSPLPWTNVDRISLVFDRAVSIDASALTLVHSQLGVLAVAAMPSYDAATFTATWTLSAPIAAGHVLLSLNDTKVRTAGLALDGEWVNGWPAEISGNGTPGGAFLFTFHVVPGDSNQDGRLDANDLWSVVSAAFTSPATAQFRATRDLDGSGVVNYVDAIFSRNLAGTSAVASPSAAAIVTGANSPIASRTAMPRRTLRAAATDRAFDDGEFGEDANKLVATRSARGELPATPMRVSRAMAIRRP